MGQDPHQRPGGRPDGEQARILPDDARRSAPFTPYSPLPPAGHGEQTTQPPSPSAPAESQPPRGCTSSVVIVVGILAVLVLSCMLLAFATLQNGLAGIGRLAGGLPSFNFPALATPTVIIDTHQPAVVDRIRAIGKLESVNYQVDKVISGTSTGPLPLFLTGDRILLVAHGEVVAGVDLEKMASSDLTATGKIVTVKLPPAEILYSKLDNDKTYVYDRQTGIFSKPDPHLESEVRAVAEQQIVQAAREDGILAKGTQNAQQTLSTLLRGLGYDEVQFKEGP